MHRKFLAETWPDETYSHDLHALVMIDTEIWSKCLQGGSSSSKLKWKNTQTRRLRRHSHISLLIRQVETCNFWDSFALILMSSLALEAQGFIRTNTIQTIFHTVSPVLTSLILLQNCKNHKPTNTELLYQFTNIKIWNTTILHTKLWLNNTTDCQSESRHEDLAYTQYISKTCKWIETTYIFDLRDGWGL